MSANDARERAGEKKKRTRSNKGRESKQIWCTFRAKHNNNNNKSQPTKVGIAFWYFAIIYIKCSRCWFFFAHSLAKMWVFPHIYVCVSMFHVVNGFSLCFRLLMFGFPAGVSSRSFFLSDRIVSSRLVGWCLFVFYLIRYDYGIMLCWWMLAV